jgi:hypothetical protein
MVILPRGGNKDAAACLQTTPPLLDSLNLATRRAVCARQSSSD